MALRVDFTYPTYRDLLEAGVAANYEFLTVREYLAAGPGATDTDPERTRGSDAGRGQKGDNGTGLPERFVILRHDVDRKPRNALAIARLEAEYNVTSTFYVRTIEKTFKPDIIRRIAGLGHEVGYHYEDLVRESGDPDRAVDRFERELARVRSLVPVDTVCMHGNPLSPYDNRDLWDHASFEQFDLLGEAYLSMDFEDLTYFSDTGRTWRDGDLKIKDHTMGEGGKDVQVATTFELAGLLLAERVDRAYVLAHPNRWAGSYPELFVERAKDAATNVAKRVFTTVT